MRVRKDPNQKLVTMLWIFGLKWNRLVDIYVSTGFQFTFYINYNVMTCRQHLIKSL